MVFGISSFCHHWYLLWGLERLVFDNESESEVVRKFKRQWIEFVRWTPLLLGLLNILQMTSFSVECRLRVKDLFTRVFWVDAGSLYHSSFYDIQYCVMNTNTLFYDEIRRWLTEAKPIERLRAIVEDLKIVTINKEISGRTRWYFFLSIYVPLTHDATLRRLESTKQLCVWLQLRILFPPLF